MTDRRNGCWDRRTTVFHGPIIGSLADSASRPERRQDAETRAAWDTVRAEAIADITAKGWEYPANDQIEIGIRAGLRYRKEKP